MLRPLPLALCCALLAFGMYWLLRQQVFFKIDGQYLVLRLDRGDIGHPYNALYMPLLAALQQVVAPLGLSAYWIAVLFSALGTSLGVGLVHLALRDLGMTVAAALWATALVAVAPPVAFFATVVEHHGPFFAFAGLAFWVTVRFARRPTYGWAAGLGVVTHLAYAVHGSGNLLPAVLLPLFLAWRWPAGRLWRDLGWATLAGAIHLGLFFALLRYEVTGLQDGVFNALESGIGRPKHLSYLPAVTWQEWVRPFLPLSVLWLWAWSSRRWRPEALALTVGLLPYLGLCLLLIVGEEEFGAYLLPLVIPAARLTLLGLPRWLIAVAVLASLGLSWQVIKAHDDATGAREFVAGLRAELAAGPQHLWVGGTAEIGYCLAGAPEVEFHPIVGLVQGVDPADYAQSLQQFDMLVQMSRQLGQPLLLTAGGRRSLLDPELPFGRVLLDHIRATCDPEQITRGAFALWRLR